MEAKYAEGGTPSPNAGAFCVPLSSMAVNIFGLVFRPLYWRLPESAWRPNDFVLICLPPLCAGTMTGYRWPDSALGAIFRATIALAASLLGVLCLCAVVLETVAFARELWMQWWMSNATWQGLS